MSWYWIHEYFHGKYELVYDPHMFGYFASKSVRYDRWTFKSNGKSRHGGHQSYTTI